jgi:hypothetical protein
MNQREIIALLEEAGRFEISWERRGEIRNQLAHEVRGDERVGFQNAFLKLWELAILPDQRADHLRELAPLFLLLCLDREGDGLVTDPMEIDWAELAPPTSGVATPAEQ